MTYRTTSLCDEDIIEIHVRGVADFGIDQAERYHAGLMSTFELIASNPRLARQRREFVPPVRMHPYRAHMIAYVEDEDHHPRPAWPTRLGEPPDALSLSSQAMNRVTNSARTSIQSPRPT